MQRLHIVKDILSVNVCVCPECKTTTLGREYMGTMTTTVNGYTCRPWTPYSAARVDSNYPDGSIAAASNYCRNTDSDGSGPWCYTTDPNKNWEYCPAPLCASNCIYLGV